ncbi:MAG: site-2 protease family protein [Chloroflexia bacterium]|nr:site-2 protease family protein [Chloroflexia bacterium]
MGAQISLGRIWGIPVGLHWSLLLVFALLTWSLADGFLLGRNPELDLTARWVIAVLTSVFFFASILLHELGHAWVAQRNGIPVNRITLFIFGGAAEIDKQAKTPGVEFRVAVGGPVVSLALAASFGLLAVATQNVAVLGASFFWLAQINLMLLLFNLVPGYPLDGGRMLRAAVWHFTKSERRATTVAMFSGQIVAFGLMAIGGYLIFSGNFINGIWLIFIGWFLQNATVAEQSSATVQQQLAGIKVGQAMGMIKEPRVPSRLKIQQLVDDYALPHGQRTFLVMDDEVPRGLVTLRNLAQVPRERWAWASVTEAMTPWSELTKVTPDIDLIEAMKLMDDQRVGQVPVVDGTRVVGLLTREEIIHLLRLRMELGT